MTKMSAGRRAKKVSATRRRGATTQVTGTRPSDGNKLSISNVLDQMRSPGLGFDRVEHIAGSSYKESSTVIVVPTRGKYKMLDPNDPEKKREVEVEGLIDKRVVAAWQALINPMNQKRAMLFASGHEVGRAYDAMIQQILDQPQLRDWKYILTLEDDNIPPPDAHLKLLESMDFGNYDAVSALYFTKGEGLNMPMAYGDPAEYARTGALDFRPRDVREALAAGQIMPVNGIAMGCALWKMSLFREIKPPWYVTLNDWVPGKGIVGMTQDLSFCERAVRAGKRFAVDMRVKVGHLDVSSGLTY